MKPTKEILDFLVGKKIVCHVIDDHEFTITEIYDFHPEDRDVGIFGACAYCVTSEGNEVGVWDDGSVYDDDDNLLALVESDFGIEIPDYEPEYWPDEED